MKAYEGSKACFWQKLKKNAYGHFNLPSLKIDYKDRIMTQLYLFDFDEQPERSKRIGTIPSVEKFQGALLLSAIGDALGWPTEFLKTPDGHRLPFELPVRNFVGWHKLVGGKWWGHDQYIEPGMYSDDTQLALAIAQSITDEGEFNAERFAYEELPLWLQYEQGGGRSVKTAARKLIGKDANWLNNFYRQDKLDYREAGANGAAMRNLPIALANVTDESKIITDSFLNAVITHGHPRAILGTIVFALAINYALTRQTITTAEMQQYLHDHMCRIGKIVDADDRISSWSYHWNRATRGEKTPFRQDHDYIVETATRLHSIVAHEPRNYKLLQKLSDRRDAYFRMLAWEIGLHDMFWDALGKGGIVTHPTLGRGMITEKIERPIKREGYIVKLIHIQFDSGQTCVFHSRVRNNEQVSESLTQDLLAALQGEGRVK
jgi:ADP-ribosylglycohydrolase